MTSNQLREEAARLMREALALLDQAGDASHAGTLLDHALAVLTGG